MKKIILTIMISLFLSTNVISSYAATTLITPLEITQDNAISPLSEETVWYQRVYNGMIQKRLWSITYGKWLTDWIDVAPVE